MDLVNQMATHVNGFENDPRKHLRVGFKVPLRIHCRSGELILGHTVDVSESGIGAMVSLELIVGQSVGLGFQLPCGLIDVRAVVKNKRAFRYGFEFVLTHQERGILKRGCREIAMSI
jgi:hypothetical protein